ncbi:T9SS type A sorting domain-containing protein [Polaribacter sp. Hel_I_88]|uniref:T9SS type A sorting domain-containing protein n=1 Tax=Polaribacter sp. Hel_I_88 TaxID=1250006 RepID=UPI000478B2AC|nr:T9SS type A sorting domain-containing protein [Polaribacter sp. Hel_I_88]
MKKITLFLFLIPFIALAQGPWEFNTLNDLEGWTASQGNAGASGILTANGSDLGYVTVAGNQAASRNPTFIKLGANIDGSAFSVIEIRLKNGTDATFMRFKEDGSYTSGVTITAQDAEYKTYVYPISGTGTITDIQFEFKNDNGGTGTNFNPNNAGGEPIDIDYVRPANVDVPIQNEFTFETATDVEGFTSLLRATAVQASESGVGTLQLTMSERSTNDSKVGLDALTFKVDGDAHKYAHITLKNTSTNNRFLLSSDGANFLPFQTITISDSEYTTYDFDLSEWSGFQNPELVFSVDNTWVATDTYAVDDEVVFGNSTYKNLTGVNDEAANPKNDPTNWVLEGTEGALSDLANSIYIDSIVFDSNPGEIVLSTSSVKNEVTFSVYPNPSQDFIMIDAPTGINQISVYSVLGKLVKKEQVSSKKHNLDISSFAKGVYLLRVENNEGISAKRIIKN